MWNSKIGSRSRYSAKVPGRANARHPHLLLLASLALFACSSPVDGASRSAGGAFAAASGSGGLLASTGGAPSAGAPMTSGTQSGGAVSSGGVASSSVGGGGGSSGPGGAGGYVPSGPCSPPLDIKQPIE